ncbi:MAG: ABC transporter permease [Thermoplasmatota archaeon]
MTRGDRIDVAAELSTVGMVWRREMIRFVRARSRIVGGLVQPILFLFVLGYGLGSLVPAAGGVDYKRFIFPGTLSMSVVTTSIFSAISIVWDREFGFLREMLVAPVSRASIVLGKTSGGATVATSQGAIMLLLAPVVGVTLTPLLVVEVLGIAMLMAFALTSFGVFVASRMKKMEGFQVVMQFLLFPMIFLSGAMFPLANVPTWLSAIAHLDPLTYAIDPMRRVILGAQFAGSVPPAVAARFGNGVTLFGAPLGIGTELVAVALFALFFLALAVRGFSKYD